MQIAPAAVVTPQLNMPLLGFAGLPVHATETAFKQDIKQYWFDHGCCGPLTVRPTYSTEQKPGQMPFPRCCYTLYVCGVLVPLNSVSTTRLRYTLYVGRVLVTVWLLLSKLSFFPLKIIWKPYQYDSFLHQFELIVAYNTSVWTWFDNLRFQSLHGPNCLKITAIMTLTCTKIYVINCNSFQSTSWEPVSAIGVSLWEPFRCEWCQTVYQWRPQSPDWKTHPVKRGKLAWSCLFWKGPCGDIKYCACSAADACTAAAAAVMHYCCFATCVLYSRVYYAILCTILVYIYWYIYIIHMY